MRDMFMYRPRQDFVWIPVPIQTVVDCRPMEYVPMPAMHHMHALPCKPAVANVAKPAKQSADELCAASVLLNLTPAAAPDPSSRFRAVQEPMPASVVSAATSDPVKSKRAKTVSQHSGSEGDSSADDASVSSDSSSDDSVATREPPAPIKWYPGSTSLTLPEDDDFLSPLHCFMRRYCVEAFSATPEDVATPRYGKSHGVKVVVGQVGIRCLYCKHRPLNQRPERSVCFPSSLRNIYHSIETWQRRHSVVCTDIAPWVKKSMMELMLSSKTRAGGRRQYWEEAAMKLGMVNTPQGVRFSRPPGTIDSVAPVKEVLVESGPPAEPVVREQDRHMVTDFLYLLLEQMETCQFTEEDRSGGRSKIKDIRVGFPGMQCKHCRGKAGFGRYFPSSVNALALANSDRNIYNHIQKCRRCPPRIKAELVRFSKEQTQCKNKRGLRKLFFKRVWGRIHGTKQSS